MKKDIASAKSCMPYKALMLMQSVHVLVLYGRCTTAGDATVAFCGCFQVAYSFPTALPFILLLSLIHPCCFFMCYLCIQNEGY